MRDVVYIDILVFSVVFLSLTTLLGAEERGRDRIGWVRVPDERLVDILRSCNLEGVLTKMNFMCSWICFFRVIVSIPGSSAASAFE